jgi:hypothetical protein
MADNSLTDNGGTGNGADDSSTVNQTDRTAETHNDTGSGGDTQDTVDTSTNHDDGGDGGDDDGLAKFAKGQGYDSLDDFSERELELLKRQKKQVDEFRNNKDRIQSKDELREVEDQIYKPQVDDDLDDYEKREAARDAQIAKLAASQRKRDFFDSIPEAKEYEADMARLIQTEAERNGVEAARYLASDLRRVYVLARDLHNDDAVRTASETARREERELLRQKQEAGSGSQAASSSQRRSPKVNNEWVQNEYDPSNPEHRKMVDEAIARGDLY